MKIPFSPPLSPKLMLFVTTYLPNWQAVNCSAIWMWMIVSSVCFQINFVLVLSNLFHRTWLIPRDSSLILSVKMADVGIMWMLIRYWQSRADKQFCCWCQMRARISSADHWIECELSTYFLQYLMQCENQDLWISPQGRYLNSWIHLKLIDANRDETEWETEL